MALHSLERFADTVRQLLVVDVDSSQPNLLVLVQKYPHNRPKSTQVSRDRDHILGVVDSIPGVF